MNEYKFHGSQVGEPFFDMNWSLPLSKDGQVMLFKRINNEFDVATAIVPSHMKKKYRMKDVELRVVRNLIAIFSQLTAFLTHRLSEDEVEKMSGRIEKGNTIDSDLLELLRLKPKKVAASMLASQRELALRALRDQERSSCAGIQDSLLNVRTAKFEHFKKSIVQDWQHIMAAKGALKVLSTRLHIKKVDWLRGQSSIGSTAVSTFMDRSMRIHYQPKMELLPTLLHDMVMNVEKITNTKDIYFIGFVDMNCPHAKRKERTEVSTATCTGITWGTHC
jgi:hypothetical protein